MRRITPPPQAGGRRSRRATRRNALASGRRPRADRDGQQARTQLVAKVERLRAVGYLDDQRAPEAALELDAMLEGLANAELRASVLRLLPEDNEEEVWRNALATVVRGFRGA